MDISKIRGTGPGGRITKEDVLNFKQEEIKSFSRPKPNIRKVLPLSGMRKTIADSLTESWQGIPRAEHFMAVDVTELVEMREKNGEIWEREHGFRLSVNDLTIVAAAKALRAFPVVNAAAQDGRIEIYEDINISVAVAQEKGLFSPVILRTEGLSLVLPGRPIAWWIWFAKANTR